MIFVTLLSLSILAAALATLCVALWNALAWPRVGDAPGVESMTRGRVSILIPARDEERNIAGCLDAALAQGEVVGEVLVYDDHSRDGTARVVEEYARRDARVRLVAPAPLPSGWCGKTFACARLAAEASAGWLLFLDADARLSASAAALIVREASARGVTLLSCWPRLETRGFWEGALMPLLNFVVFTLYPAPLALRRSDASLGLAHGSCLLARRDHYESVGGHAIVRGELFEDVRLAQAWRAAGRPSLCLDGRAVVRVRMYSSLAEIWWGFQKNFFPAFRSARSFGAFMALHFLVFLAPFAFLPLAAKTTGGMFLSAAAACVLAARFALALRFGQPLWSPLLHPLGEAVLLALGVSSWLRCRTGRGVVWKGRSYLAGARTPAPIQTEGVQK
ncbi:MAG: glycosyltransferase [Pyrinomonadaceae bacterium]